MTGACPDCAAIPAPRTSAEGAMQTDQIKEEAIATICRRTGQPCSAAIVVAKHLARAARQACAAEPDLALTGQVQLEGCVHNCPAQFILNARRIEVFCNVAEDVDAAALSAFSDGFLDATPKVSGLGVLKTPPLALVRINLGVMSAQATAPMACSA